MRLSFKDVSMLLIGTTIISVCNHIAYTSIRRMMAGHQHDKAVLLHRELLTALDDQTNEDDINEVLANALQAVSEMLRSFNHDDVDTRRSRFAYSDGVIGAATKALDEYNHSKS